jgi:hypothetical protein
MKLNLAGKFSTLALATCALAASTALAEAGWVRSGGGVGPHGRTWSSSGSGNCAGGSCASHGTFIGPYGGVTTRSGETTCAGGTCNHSATITGPNGGVVTRNSTFSRY